MANQRLDPGSRLRLARDDPEFGNFSNRLLILTLVYAIAAILVLSSDASFAQSFQAPMRKMPFGIGGSEGAASPPANAFVAWLLAEQSAFYQAISKAVRDAKSDGTAVLGLVGLSFLYGVFHAAGPGHGKAVIASYMIANESALRRGTLIAFLAAALQGLVAIAIIGIIAVVLHGTARDMTAAGGYIELLSYAAIAALGLWLVWRKGRSFLFAFRASPMTADAVHVHDENCGHMHMPDPAMLSRPMLLKDLAATVLAAGLRPCTGAILVLVYALSQGIFAIGILAVGAMSLGTAITTSALAALAVFAKMLALRFASGGSRRSEIATRGLELAAAIVVTLLGAGLLLGFVESQGA